MPLTFYPRLCLKLNFTICGPATKLRNGYDFSEGERGIYPNPSGRISLESKARLPEGENEYPIHKNAPILLKT